MVIQDRQGRLTLLPTLHGGRREWTTRHLPLPQRERSDLRGAQTWGELDNPIWITEGEGDGKETWDAVEAYLGFLYTELFRRG